ncbi:hypothetical protein ACSQ67_025877 [Phaseolus vulgaris]
MTSIFTSNRNFASLLLPRVQHLPMIPRLSLLETPLIVTGSAHTSHRAIPTSQRIGLRVIQLWVKVADHNSAQIHHLAPYTTCPKARSFYRSTHPITSCCSDLLHLHKPSSLFFIRPTPSGSSRDRAITVRVSRLLELSPG